MHQGGVNVADKTLNGAYAIINAIGLLGHFVKTNLFTG